MRRRFTCLSAYGVVHDDCRTVVQIGKVDGTTKRWLVACSHDCQECDVVEDYAVFWSRRMALRYADRWIWSFDVCHRPAYYNDDKGLLDV